METTWVCRVSGFRVSDQGFRLKRVGFRGYNSTAPKVALPRVYGDNKDHIGPDK